MIEPFEKALKDIYVPALIPGVRDVKIHAATDNAIYLNKNVKTFPHSLLVKPPTSYNFSRKYTDSDDDGLTIMCIPFIANYELHTYVKKQSEAVDMVQRIALYVKRHPYVIFPYRSIPDFQIGLWSHESGITQQQVSTEDSEKGGTVDVVWQFFANLVLTSLIAVPVIQSVEVRLNSISTTDDEKITITDN